VVLIAWFLENCRNKKRSVAVDGKRGGKQRTRGPKKQVELKNFYRFQQREQKKSKLMELKQKFEADRQKIAELKANRKFKPF
jgi:ribosomal RNA-processing protein 7